MLRINGQEVDPINSSELQIWKMKVDKIELSLPLIFIIKDTGEEIETILDDIIII